MLREIRAFLIVNGNSIASQIASALNFDKVMVESALEEWVRQGKILKNKNDVACMVGCKGCNGGCPASVVSMLPEDEYYYSWVIV